jgi:hypothetical protein
VAGLKDWLVIGSVIETLVAPRTWNKLNELMPVVVKFCCFYIIWECSWVAMPKT